ncbi:LuxR C-terminal-related transcriptional regulator [Streptomyces sp. NPDC002067]
MLEALGMSTATEAVYRGMLTHPQEGAAGLAARLGLPEHRVREALDDLSAMSLIRPATDDPSRLHTVQPELAAELLLARQEAALAAQQQRLQEARAAALRLTVEVAAPAAALHGDGIEILHGTDNIQDRLVRAGSAPGTAVHACVSGRPRQSAEWRMAVPACHRVLEGGGTVRALFLDSVRTAPEPAAQVTQLASRGCRVRTAPSLPGPFLLCGRRVAFVLQQDRKGELEALVTEAPALVSLLSAQFDGLWRTAQELREPAPARGGGTVSRQEAEVLRLLLEGHTDEGVAKRLGVSHRTARRIAATVMTRLGARSRFQAGAIAALRGLIRE